MAEAQEQEEPLNEAKAGKILDTIYEKALNGIPMVSHSVDEIADDYLSHHDTPEAAARSLARWQVAKCGTSGFLSDVQPLPTAIASSARRAAITVRKAPHPQDGSTITLSEMPVPGT